MVLLQDLAYPNILKEDVLDVDKEMIQIIIHHPYSNTWIEHHHIIVRIAMQNTFYQGVDG